MPQYLLPTRILVATTTQCRHASIPERPGGGFLALAARLRQVNELKRKVRAVEV